MISGCTGWTIIIGLRDSWHSKCCLPKHHRENVLSWYLVQSFRSGSLLTKKEVILEHFVLGRRSQDLILFTIYKITEQGICNLWGVFKKVSFTVIILPIHMIQTYHMSTQFRYGRCIGRTENYRLEDPTQPSTSYNWIDSYGDYITTWCKL